MMLYTSSGQRIAYNLGMTGCPVLNLNQACATGSTGLHTARRLIQGGLIDCALVIGFEQMRPGSIKSVWDDRPSPLGPSTKLMEDTFGKHDAPRNAQYFGNAGQEYMKKSVQFQRPSPYFRSAFTNSGLGMAPRPRILRRLRASHMNTLKEIPTPNSSGSIPWTKCSIPLQFMVHSPNSSALPLVTAPLRLSLYLSDSWTHGHPSDHRLF